MNNDTTQTPLPEDGAEAGPPHERPDFPHDGGCRHRRPEHRGRGRGRGLHGRGLHGRPEHGRHPHGEDDERDFGRRGFGHRSSGRDGFGHGDSGAHGLDPRGFGHGGPATAPRDGEGDARNLGHGRPGAPFGPRHHHRHTQWAFERGFEAGFAAARRLDDAA